MGDYNDALEAAAKYLESIIDDDPVIEQFAKDHAEEIRSLKRPDDSAGGWMPIETAPKDGTVILLHLSEYSLCGYPKSIWSWKSVAVGRYDGYWQIGVPDGHASGGGDKQFTHWRPLPLHPNPQNR
jgi:hypothetical protein